MQRFAAFDIDRCFYDGTLAHDFVARLLETGVIDAELAEVVAFNMGPSDSNLVAALQAGQKSGKMAFIDYVDCGIEVGVRAATNTNLEVNELFTEVWQKLGMTTIAISTSPYAVVKPFCDNVGPFDFVIAPMAQNIDGFVGPSSIVRASERTKGEWLGKLVEMLGLSLVESIAIGDSMADASMLELVQRPIAYKPQPELFEIAKNKGWEIWE